MAGAHNFFINHSDSAPLIGQLDDSVVGMFEMTRDGVKIDKYHAMLTFAHSTYLPTFTDEALPTVETKRNGKPLLTPYYTGRDLISKCLEETPINFKRTPTWYKQEYTPYVDYSPTEVSVEIDRGRHVKGVLDKSSIGKGQAGNVYHLIGSEYGSEKALDVMYNMQQLAINYILLKGYSIGIMDMVISDEGLKQIHEIESGIIRKSQLITDKLNRGQIIPPIDKTVTEFYEEQQIAELRVMDDFIEPILRSINPDTNSLYKLIMSGSKGRMENMYHMNSTIGQILINGERIRMRFSYKRTLAYFCRFETSPESRGYITNSYMSGMTSPELVFNAMNARFDFISKALSTSITGEQNRKSIKNLESIITNNMRMCIKGTNVIQLFYGEDGLDPRKIIRVEFPTVLMSNAKLAESYSYPTEDAKLRPVFDAEYAQIRADRDEYRKIYMAIENTTVKDLMSAERFMPVNIKMIIEDTIHAYRDKAGAKDDAEVAEMVAIVKEFVSNLSYLLLNEEQERAKAPVPTHISYAVYLLGVLARSTMHSRNLKRLGKSLLALVITKIKMTFLNALVDYGCAVGIIAAQSFSGPLTQYMLDAHHRSISGGTNKTGVNKAREVLGARPTERLDSPSMLISVLPEYSADRAKVQEIANNMEMMNLRQFVVMWQVFFEKYGAPAHPKYAHEKQLIDEFQKYNPILAPPSDLIKWCVRFVLNKTTLILKNMNLELVVSRLRESFPDLYIVHTPENAKQIILRVYIKSSMFRQVEQSDIESLKDSLLNTIIRGVNGVSIASVTKMIRNRVADDGSIQRDTNRYGVTTIGTNLVGAMRLKGVDLYTIQTDAIEETQRVLGIEAARQRIISEIRNVGVSSVNYRHLTIYADEMTFTGKVTGIERQGLSTRESTNIMLRIGFSAPLPTLEEAAINSAEDKIYGLTGSLLTGNTPKYGTNYNQFYINGDFVKENTVSADSYLDAL